MVSKKDKSVQDMVRSKRKKPKYVYINGDLHKVLHIDRAQDLVWAWDYPNAKRKSYVWSDVQRTMQRAYTVSEVGKLVNRDRIRIWRYWQEGMVGKPQRIYTLDEHRKPGKFMYSEDDILAIHDYLLTVHVGRPRKDGLIRTYNLPTRAELKALLQHGTVKYIKDDTGNFIPIWREQIW